MSSWEAGLAMYDPAAPQSWPQQCQATLEAHGFRVRRPARCRLQVWREDAVQQATPSLNFVDGLILDSCWIANRRTSIRIHPHRFYFDEARTDEPLAQPEHLLLREAPRPSTPPSTLITGALQIGELLTSTGTIDPAPMNDRSITQGLVESTCGRGRHAERFRLKHDLWSGLSHAKALSIPPRLKIMLIHGGKYPDFVVREYARALEHEWLPTLGVPARPGLVRLASLDRVLPAIQAVREGTRQGDFEDAVFLVALSGEPGEALPQNQESFLSILDELGLPYRCFSEKNRQPKWSARAQALSILEGAGGTAYRLQLPRQADLEDSLLFGVDLGHAHRHRKRSQIVISVLDRFGQHVISVRRTQRLNEAIDAAALRDLLRAVRDEALKRVDYRVRRAVLFRDGRIPTRAKHARQSAESAETYRDALSLPSTLVELRKRGNPILYQRHNQSVEPAEPGTAIAPAESDVRFSRPIQAPPVYREPSRPESWRGSMNWASASMPSQPFRWACATPHHWAFPPTFPGRSTGPTASPARDRTATSSPDRE